MNFLFIILLLKENYWEKMKNIKITLVLSLVIFLSSFLFAQNENGKIVGKIIDAVSKKPLIGANIVVVGTNRGASSNINGEFEIDNLPPDSYQLKASIIGFETSIKTDVIVSAARPAQVEFELSEQTIKLQEVTVKAGYFSSDPTEVNSVRNFSYEEIRRAPGGFEDVVRALSVLPGVAQADAGRNDLIVRGGAPSENLYLIDGITVPNINHFGTQGATGGPLSFVNLDFVNRTSFSTGGFSTQYGDKLSSVLSINLRKGRTDKLGGKATISATQFGLNLEGPISDNSSFIFSARRSYLDFIFKAAGFGFVPEYYDLLSKADFKLSENQSLSFLFIGAFDHVRFFNNTADQRYNNSRVLGSNQNQYVTGLTYKNLFNNGFFKLILSRNFVDYNTSQKDSLLNPIFQDASIEAENTLRSDFVYKFSPTSEINLGADYKLIKFKADILFPEFRTTFGDSLPGVNLNTSKYYSKFAYYTNYNKSWFNRLNTNFGVRFDYFSAISKKFYISPRFSTSYKIDELNKLSFSSGVYYQSPSYIWLAGAKSNLNLSDIKANQYILGFNHQLRYDLILKVEAFLKQYNDYPTSTVRPYLVLANTGAGFNGSSDNFATFGLEPLVSSGKGLARGIELSAQKKLSDLPFYGILSITYSKTDFTALDGIENLGKYDQTWIINLSGGYKFNKYWEGSMKFRYSTGEPYTPFNSNGTQSVAYYNSARLPANHSLDVRVDKRWFFSNWTLITYVDIQNIYNRKNISGVRWAPRTHSIDKSSSIGFLPSIGVSAEF